jgi:hypothetical protein
MKALRIAAATVVALTAFSLVATTPQVARAAPCAGLFANPTSCENCLHFVEVYHTSNVCDKAAPSRPVQAAPSGVPVQTPEVLEPALPEPPSTEPALPEPPTPSMTLVQIPSPQVVSPSSRPSSTIAVAANKESSQPTQPWWPVALGYGALGTALSLVFWLISRRTGARI